MKPLVRLCKTCKHLAVLPDNDGKFRIRDSAMYRCIVPLVIPEFPSCIRPSGFSKSVAESIENLRTRVAPKDGAFCAGWQQRGAPP